MRTRLLTLRFHASLGAFDTRPLDDFLNDKELLAIREHFFVAHEVAYVACLVTYADTPSERPRRDPRAERQGQREPAPQVRLDELPPPQRALFATLREWRSERARRDGIPPYLILNNRELRAAHDRAQLKRAAATRARTRRCATRSVKCGAIRGS